MGAEFVPQTSTKRRTSTLIRAAGTRTGPAGAGRSRPGRGTCWRVCSRLTLADTLPLVAANDLKLLTAVTCHERQRLSTSLGAVEKVCWPGRKKRSGLWRQDGLAGLDDGGALRDNWREEIPLRIP